MINPDFYTVQHIELEVEKLDIDEDLKTILLTTLERYSDLKERVKELEKTAPIKFGRVGDIHVGGDILPEFNSEKWCKKCGAPIEGVHLPNCPMLASKL